MLDLSRIRITILSPCVVGMVLDQVRTQVQLLEAQEDAETEEKKEEDNGALQSAG